jgi:protein-disulfide isomerase
MKLLLIMGLIVLLGGGFLLFSNKSTNVPTPPEPPKAWTKEAFDALFEQSPHQKGNPNAPLKIVEFADGQCPMCRRTYRRIISRIGKEIDAHFAYRHFPLTTIHDRAVPCVVAMEAAGRQKKFWEMYDKIFTQSPEEIEAGKQPFSDFKPDLSDAAIEKMAKEIGLNMEQFQKDFKDDSLISEAHTAEQEAGKLGIDSTPTFVIAYKGEYAQAIGIKGLAEKLKDYPGMPDLTDELKEAKPRP